MKQPGADLSIGILATLGKRSTLDRVPSSRQARLTSMSDPLRGIQHELTDRGMEKDRERIISRAEVGDASLISGPDHTASEHRALVPA